MAWLRWHKIHLILHISQYLHKMEKYSNCFSQTIHQYMWLKWHKIHPCTSQNVYIKLEMIPIASQLKTRNRLSMLLLIFKHSWTKINFVHLIPYLQKYVHCILNKGVLLVNVLNWKSQNHCLLFDNQTMLVIVLFLGFGKMSNHVVRPLWSRVHQYWMIPELPGLFDHKLSHSQKSPLAFPCSAKSDQNLWIIFPLSKPV